MPSSAVICCRSHRRWQGGRKPRTLGAAVHSGRDTMNNQPAENQALESRAREFQFTDSDFHALRTLVKEMTGINLADSKRELVYGRVSRRLRALGLPTFGEYRELLESGDGSELVAFCNALTTNLTSFFREAHHFDYLRDEFLAARR